jgi:hypothetical protein
MSGKVGIEITRRILGGVGSVIAAAAYGVLNFSKAREEWADLQGDELVAIAKDVLEVEIPKVVAVFKPDSTTLI